MPNVRNHTEDQVRAINPREPKIRPTPPENIRNLAPSPGFRCPMRQNAHPGAFVGKGCNPRDGNRGELSSIKTSKKGPTYWFSVQQCLNRKIAVPARQPLHLLLWRQVTVRAAPD